MNDLSPKSNLRRKLNFYRNVVFLYSVIFAIGFLGFFGVIQIISEDLRLIQAGLDRVLTEAAGSYVRVDLDTCNVNEARITVWSYAKD